MYGGNIHPFFGRIGRPSGFHARVLVLGRGGRRSSMIRPERKLAAIFVADIVGFSRLAGGDEERVLARLRALRSDLIDPTFAVHNGRIVKRTGDGVLAEFRSVVDAVRCAIEIQDGMRERNAGLPPDRVISLRIGIHLGDVVEEVDGDLMGDGVNIAARLEGVSKPGAICLSEDAYRQVKSRLDLSVTDMGEKQLKNIADPIRVFSLELGPPQTFRPVPAPPTEPETFGKPTLIVLPFSSVGGDDEQDLFADGLVDDITTELSRINVIKVISSRTAFTFKVRDISTEQVFKELDVFYIVQGTVRRTGKGVRITAQLISRDEGGALWADKYDRSLADIFEIQDEIVRSVVASLQTQISIHIEPQTRTNSPKASSWFLTKRAMKEFYNLTRESLNEGETLAREAIAIDPTNSKAFGVLAGILVHRSFMGFADDHLATANEALTVVRHALALDSQDELAHWIHGTIHGLGLGDNAKAVAPLKRSIEINPNYSLAYGTLGTVLAALDRADEAIENTEYAIQLNPRDPSIFFRYSGLSQAYFGIEDFDNAIAWAEKSASSKPNWWLAQALLAASFALTGQTANARASLKSLRAILPHKTPETLPLERFSPKQRSLLIEGLRLAEATD